MVVKIEGAKILITGSNRGIGLALAQELNRRGAIIYGGMRDPSGFEGDFENASNFHPVACDLGDRGSIEQFLNDMKDEDFDAVVNNAGQLTGGLIEDQDLDAIYSMFQVNLVGLIHLTRGLIPNMVKRGKGKIINNASVSGVMHLPCASTYAAAKTGVVAFTNSINLELKDTGVTTLTLLTPGIKTRMFDEISNLYGDKMDVSSLSSITPEEYAKEVTKCIEKDKLFYNPGGSVGVALWLARHLPGVFRKLGGMGFKRS
jgi:short-subunit dehydrogenase